MIGSPARNQGRFAASEPQLHVKPQGDAWPPEWCFTRCHRRTLHLMCTDHKAAHGRRQSCFGVYLAFTHQGTSMKYLPLALLAALFVSGPTWAQGLTRPQNNAVRSAKQYISISGFSRNGLINQLSLSAGDGYDIADATIAVDSLNIDWNKQAARSAEQYLSISGFSCKGLINQLSSSAGDKYTVSQATYGAQQVGACH